MPKGMGNHYKNIRSGYIFLIRQINSSFKTNQPCDYFYLEDAFILKFNLSEGILDKLLKKLEKRKYIEIDGDEIIGKKEFITKGLVTDIDFEYVMGE